MAKEQYVEVELIKNPSVKRTMNVNSFKMNTKKWRLQSESFTPIPVKKKAVEPAVKFTSNISANPLLEAQSDAGEFAHIESVKTDVSAIDSLRAQYEAKTGNKPDGRWNVSRLTKEING